MMLYSAVTNNPNSIIKKTGKQSLFAITHFAVLTHKISFAQNKRNYSTICIKNQFLGSLILAKKFSENSEPLEICKLLK